MTIILFLFYLILGRIVPWSMSVTLALYLGRKSHLPVSLGLIVLVGLMEDIAHVRPMGLTSLVLGSLTAGVWLLESLYRNKSLWWWFGFGLIGEVVIHLIGRESLSIQGVIAQLIALLIIFWINQHNHESEGIYVG